MRLAVQRLVGEEMGLGGVEAQADLGAGLQNPVLGYGGDDAADHGADTACL